MGAYQESELADRTDHFGNKTVLSPFFFSKTHHFCHIILE